MAMCLHFPSFYIRSISWRPTLLPPEIVVEIMMKPTNLFTKVTSKLPIPLLTLVLFLSAFSSDISSSFSWRSSLAWFNSLVIEAYSWKQRKRVTWLRKWTLIYQFHHLPCLERQIFFPLFVSFLSLLTKISPQDVDLLSKQELYSSFGKPLQTLELHHVIKLMDVYLFCHLNGNSIFCVEQIVNTKVSSYNPSTKKLFVGK